MDWRQALRRRVIAASAAASAAGGVSYNRRPQDGGYPWLVLQVISDTAQQDLKGFVGSDPARVQFDALGMTIEDAVALANVARDAVAPAGTFDGVAFGRAMIEPRPDTGAQTETEFIHRVSFDALFWHE